LVTEISRCLYDFCQLPRLHASIISRKTNSYSIQLVPEISLFRMFRPMAKCI
jgi:hypothetical protein